MTKILKIIRPDRCNGCELCVLETQRQLEKVGLEGALIRVFRNKEAGSEYPQHLLDIDPRVNSLHIEKIKTICPAEVFETEESDRN